MRNKLQWNLNRNTYIFIQENTFENVIWKTTAILSRPECVNVTLYSKLPWLQRASNVAKAFMGLHLNVYFLILTHWGRVTHICVSKLTIIGSDTGLLPGWCQAIIWTNAGILLIKPCGTNFDGILIKIKQFSFKKMRLKMSSGKRGPFCLGLNVLRKCMPNQSPLRKKIAKFDRYSQTYNIRHTKSQNWNVSHLMLQLPLPNPSKPGVKSRMKM